MRRLLCELQTELEALEAGIEPSWERVIEPLERLNDRFGFSWGAVGHLMGVKNSDALRAAHDEVLAEVVGFGLRLSQSRPLYEALLAMREGANWSSLEAAQQRIIESLLRDARHAGVGLEGEARDRFNAIQEELAELTTRFSNHVLDATKTYDLVLRDAADVEGLPASWRELAAQSAREEAGEADATAEAGPWRVTLDQPSFFPYLEHGRRRDLREKLYRAYVSRASDGELDNAPVISRELALRREEAQLLGYANFAELSLASKMAPDVAAVERLLEELRGVSYGAAQRDLGDLQAHADEGDPEAGPLRHWDVAFWAERLREHRFDYSEEELRPYFPLPKVLEGLFALAHRLFGVTIRAADGEAPIWHEDVRFFRVCDEGGSPIAAFFLDPYSRPQEKRGGAWMDECVGRSRLLAGRGEAVRLPVAYLVCNQTPPVEGKPSLMSFAEVTTLFHEFGHGLQHMLTQVDFGLAAGIRNVEWDAVELPSQFMENWCYQRETLQEVSAHFETGEPLPDGLFDKLDAARTYRAGSAMLRQLYFSSTDLELHGRYDPNGSEDPFAVQRRIARETTVLPPLPEDRFLCSFGHIFAGGYAAGYYSYKWAEVLSADAFAAFEEAGLGDCEAVAETGRRFRDTVLALGGSRAPMEVFRAFRGRDAEVEALLRHSGLTREAA
ncbi:MAG: M3 family metallopeptidase [Deltaproteobacteria bacterium]|nr:M3 family metallopeptidase [Deltaproteobacteria bacterium]